MYETAKNTRKITRGLAVGIIFFELKHRPHPRVTAAWGKVVNIAHMNVWTMTIGSSGRETSVSLFAVGSIVLWYSYGSEAKACRS